MACRAPEFRAGDAVVVSQITTQNGKNQTYGWERHGAVRRESARHLNIPFRDPAPPASRPFHALYDTCFRIPFRKLHRNARPEDAGAHPPFHTMLLLLAASVPRVSRKPFGASAPRASRRLLVLDSGTTDWSRRPVRGDPGGRPESPRVLRTVPGRILPSSRPGRCAAERGADATLCGGASTSSPPARARRARVTVRPTYRDGVGRSVWSRGACGAPGLSSFVGLLERAAAASRSWRVLRGVDGSVPTGDEPDCSRHHGRAKDHDVIKFELPCSARGWRGKQPKIAGPGRPDISIGCNGSAPMAK